MHAYARIHYHLSEHERMDKDLVSASFIQASVFLWHFLYDENHGTVLLTAAVAVRVCDCDYKFECECAFAYAAVCPFVPV